MSHVPGVASGTVTVLCSRHQPPSRSPASSLPQKETRHPSGRDLPSRPRWPLHEFALLDSHRTLGTVLAPFVPGRISGHWLLVITSIRVCFPRGQAVLHVWPSWLSRVAFVGELCSTCGLCGWTVWPSWLGHVAFVAELCFHVCLRGWAVWPSWLSRVLPVATLRALYPFSHQGTPGERHLSAALSNAVVDACVCVSSCCGSSGRGGHAAGSGGGGGGTLRF